MRYKMAVSTKRCWEERRPCITQDDNSTRREAYRLTDSGTNRLLFDEREEQACVCPCWCTSQTLTTSVLRSIACSSVSKLWLSILFKHDPRHRQELATACTAVSR